MLLAGGKIITALHPRHFGQFLLGFFAVLLVILKFMNDYAVGKNSTLYLQLNSIMLSFPIFIAIALTLIFHRMVVGYRSMVIMFFIWLIIAYVVLTPIILSGI